MPLLCDHLPCDHHLPCNVRSSHGGAGEPRGTHPAAVQHLYTVHHLPCDHLLCDHLTCDHLPSDGTRDVWSGHGGAGEPRGACPAVCHCLPCNTYCATPTIPCHHLPCDGTGDVAMEAPDSRVAPQYNTYCVTPTMIPMVGHLLYHMTTYHATITFRAPPTMHYLLCDHILCNHHLLCDSACNVRSSHGGIRELGGTRPAAEQHFFTMHHLPCDGARDVQRCRSWVASCYCATFIYRATAPETCGAAMEVPESRVAPVLLLCAADSMFDPGANTSTHGPRFEKSPAKHPRQL